MQLEGVGIFQDYCLALQDVWLEAARLEKPANAKAVLAKACGSVLVVSSMVELLRQRLASPGSCRQNAGQKPWQIVGETEIDEHD